MNELEIFKNDEFGEVRTALINEKPYFCGNDIAKALGYKRPNDAISQHCRATVKHPINISGKTQDINFIPESDIHRILSNCKTLDSNKKEMVLEYFKEVGIISNDLIPLTSRKEIEFKSKITDILNTAKTIVKDYVTVENADIITKVISQYPILDYKLDFYLPFFHIAIEYDEDEHKWKTEEDIERQRTIKQYFESNNSYINIIRVKENNENQFVGELIGYLINFYLQQLV